MNFFRRLLEKENHNILNDLEDSVVVDTRQFRSGVNPLEESRQYENEWQSDNDIGY